jgi:hypothetical protein
MSTIPPDEPGAPPAKAEQSAAGFDYQSFMSLVGSMRAMQKVYFKTRDPAPLEESKAMERIVDRRLAEWRQKQGQLFNHDDTKL